MEKNINTGTFSLEMEKISAGSRIIDSMFGGYEKDTITTVYGPAGSGKTCLALLAAIAVLRKGSKVIMIDTEGSFSAERFSQLSQDHNLLKNLLILKPVSFEEQKKVFQKLKDMIDQSVGLIIVDTISMLYRLELGKNEDIYETNKALGNQISFLSEIARKKHIPVFLTNQVYSSFEDRDQVKMVGGDILKYGSKCLLELQKMHKNRRRVVLKKHRSCPEKSVIFEITEKGLERSDILF
ncbi:DNA repair and recombination protein RadB [Candidatus Woesearchaeota archaeon]|nr:DNA repair and recombination protein RadB [Candidatus Woesearchaeota archaeon]